MRGGGLRLVRFAAGAAASSLSSSSCDKCSSWVASSSAATASVRGEAAVISWRRLFRDGADTRQVLDCSRQSYNGSRKACATWHGPCPSKCQHMQMQKPGRQSETRLMTFCQLAAALKAVYTDPLRISHPSCRAGAAVLQAENG